MTRSELLTLIKDLPSGVKLTPLGETEFYNHMAIYGGSRSLGTLHIESDRFVSLSFNGLLGEADLKRCLQATADVMGRIALRIAILKK